MCSDCRGDAKLEEEMERGLVRSWNFWNQKLTGRKKCIYIILLFFCFGQAILSTAEHCSAFFSSINCCLIIYLKCCCRHGLVKQEEQTSCFWRCDGVISSLPGHLMASRSQSVKVILLTTYHLNKQINKYKLQRVQYALWLHGGSISCEEQFVERWSPSRVNYSVTEQNPKRICSRKWDLNFASGAIWGLNEQCFFVTRLNENWPGDWLPQ